ncbi:uncharacterized protein EV422DRAFT_563373 [Fimicolochytrium jonesii]|uniref:uncharacterized protein n=1 Tax=Fimicolochytrium jonesii TaxID=1396493 RepID=UPI0022FE66E2|nr:uncharacterized protein EV422DRAFT_563373 [Fimicolochytrium jonesii]KAI8827288.1 hypothetical protein EV422DRAFT_563373 [Fimicolochytrium jonesii]
MVGDAVVAEKEQGAKPQPVGPVFEGWVKYDPTVGKKVGNWKDCQAFFGKRGGEIEFFVTQGSITKWECHAPKILGRIYTASDHFQLRLKSHGTFRFHTDNPGQSKFYRFCSNFQRTGNLDEFVSPAGTPARAAGGSEQIESPPVANGKPIVTLSSLLPAKPSITSLPTSTSSDPKAAQHLLPLSKPAAKPTDITPIKKPISIKLTLPKPPGTTVIPRDTVQRKVDSFRAAQEQIIKESRSPAATNASDTSQLDKSSSKAAHSDDDLSTLVAQIPRQFYGSEPRKRPMEDLLPSVRQTKMRRASPPIKSDGIKNSGQTCYMAATLQMLYFSPFKACFQQAILPLLKASSGAGSIWKAVADVFDWRDDHLLVHLNPLRRTLHDVIQQFHADRQEDAQEFLTAILSQMKTEFNLLGLKGTRSPVESMFDWHAERTLECRSCQNKSHGSESFINMPLDLIGPPGRELYLDSLVTSFFKGGEVEWKCDRCGAARASKTYRLESMPPVIIIHLKRFNLEPKSFTIRKRNDAIVIPPEINFGRFKSGPASVKTPDTVNEVHIIDLDPEPHHLNNENVAPLAPSNLLMNAAASSLADRARQQSVEPPPAEAGVKRNQYVLRSIVSHLGSKPFRGHYITDVYDRGKGTWTCYDDTVVTQNNDSAVEERRCTAYLLAYVHPQYL